MVDRETILAEIRRTAKGEKALGRAAFASETGIRDAHWERYWPRWGDAVRDAGLDRNELWTRVPDDEVLSALAIETRRLGRMPTSRELRLRHREDPTVPSHHIFARWPQREKVQRLTAWCEDHPEFADVVGLIGPMPNPAEDRAAPSRAGALGTVYLLKVGRHYKLGRANSFGRRQRELAIQLPEHAQTIHVIKTDDPVGIETYWHHRFADRRGNGEWFALTAEDVAAFRRRKFM